MSSPGDLTESGRSAFRTPSRSSRNSRMASHHLGKRREDRIARRYHGQQCGREGKQHQPRPLQGIEPEAGGGQLGQKAPGRLEDEPARDGPQRPAEEAKGEGVALELAGDIAVMGADEMQDL